MKKIIFIVGLLLLQVQAHAQDSTVNYLNCSVTGKNLIKSEALEDLGVTSIASSTFAVTLGEVVNLGSYMTYLHLTLTLNRDNLTLSTNIKHTSVQKVIKSEKNPYSYTVVIQSRVDNNQSMQVKVDCAPVRTGYLFVPVGKYDNSALNIFQNVPETILTIGSHLDDNRFDLTSFASVSEFLAAIFCLKGSAENALAEMKELTLTSNIFWRHRTLDSNQIIAPSLSSCRK